MGARTTHLVVEYRLPLRLRAFLTDTSRFPVATPRGDRLWLPRWLRRLQRAYLVRNTVCGNTLVPTTLLGEPKWHTNNWAVPTATMPGKHRITLRGTFKYRCSSGGPLLTGPIRPQKAITEGLEAS